MIIKGPSGVAFEARRFRGEEIKQVADALEEGQSMSDRAMCDLLSSCWLSTVDQGPYDIAGKPNFYNQALKDDIPGLLLSLRVGSFRTGSDYYFAVRCEDNSCKARVPWYVDIKKHVLSRVRGLSPAGREFVATKTPITIEFPDDDWTPEHEGERVLSVGVRLSTLASEEPIRKFLRQEIKRKQRKTKDMLLADRIAAQLVTINGEDFKGLGERVKFSRALEQENLYYLRDRIDEHSCEVDTTITVRCPECNWEFDTALPFGASFLDPTIWSRRERLFGLPGEEAVSLPSTSSSAQPSEPSSEG